MNDEPRSDDQGTTLARRPIGRRLSAQELRDRRRRVITWTLSITLGILLVNALVGESGYLANLQARREEDQLRAEVARILKENQGLIDDGRRLQDDPAAIEEAARRNLGLIRPGETLIILRDVPSAEPKPAAR